MTVRMPLSTMAALIIGVCLTLFVSGRVPGRPATRWPSTPTTSAASSPARTGPKPASGSSPRRRSCRRDSCRIVVTDDRGRYRRARPAEGDLPRVGARLRAGRFAEGRRRRPGKPLNLTAVAAPNPHEAARVLPGGLLVLAAHGAGRRASFPARPTATASRPRSRARPSGCAQVKSGGCTGLSSARQQGDARDPAGARHVRLVHRGAGSGASSPARPAPR